MTYKLFDSAYVIGVDPQVPAPSANAWAAVAVGHLLVHSYDLIEEKRYKLNFNFAFVRAYKTCCTIASAR